MKNFPRINETLTVNYSFRSGKFMPFVMRMSILKSYRELKILAWQLNKIFQDFHLKFVAFITILLNALINDFFGMFLRRFKGNSAVVWPALGSIDLGPDHTSAESCSFL